MLCIFAGIGGEPHYDTLNLEWRGTSQEDAIEKCNAYHEAYVFKNYGNSAIVEARCVSAEQLQKETGLIQDWGRNGGKRD